MTIYIFLYANFLLIPAQNNYDIYSDFENLVPKPYKIIILSAIFKELEYKIERLLNKTKLKREYKFAIQILEKYNFERLEIERKKGQIVDDLIVETALTYKSEKNIVYIATNDKELRNKCKKMNIKSIFLRQKRKIAIE